MRYPIDKYAQLTGESMPQLSRRLTELGGKEIGQKTLWNWANGRYKFRVIVECDDDDYNEIVGVFKEYRIV
jgi:hypothetical protein